MNKSQQINFDKATVLIIKIALLMAFCDKKFHDSESKIINQWINERAEKVTKNKRLEVKKSYNTVLRDTKKIINFVNKYKQNFIVIYSNNDPGAKIIIDNYKKLLIPGKNKVFRSLRFENFISLLKHSEFIIGNSSSGIIEAEIYSVPTINVGTRQKNRSSNESIMNVDSKKQKILDSISKVDGKEIKSSFSFGDGKSTKRFFDVILSEKIWDVSIQKQFVENYE